MVYKLLKKAVFVGNIQIYHSKKNSRDCLDCPILFKFGTISPEMCAILKYNLNLNYLMIFFKKFGREKKIKFFFSKNGQKWHVFKSLKKSSLQMKLEQMRHE